MSQTLELLSLKEKAKNKSVPNHIAIIMDGNRRYAKKENLTIEEGHIAGAKNLLKITEAALKLQIKVLTVYAFSTENWLRSDPEIQALFHIFELYLNKMRPLLLENRIKLSTIGDLSPFPTSLKTIIYEVKELTKNGDALELVLAINYGGRDDLTRAVKKISADILNQTISESDICESLISNYLDTAKYEDPQLLIRTSGEQRLSNFLLWQLSYTEIFLAKVLWPEFSVENFHEAIECYRCRNKRLGV
jgi:undecaprenyl diphosphate synthase